MDSRWVTKFLNEGSKVLCASIAASDPTRRAWVAVVPIDSRSSRPFLNRHGIAPDVTPRFCVRAFEVPLEVLAKEQWLEEEEKLNQRDKFADSLEEVSEILGSLGTDLSQLDQPWKSKCPVF